MNERRLPDADLLTALLRIVAVPVLLVGEVYVPKPEPSEGRFYVVLAAFTLYALATLAIARWNLSPRGHAGSGWPWPTSSFAVALTYSSGGGFSQLRFAFLFPVVVVAFRGRPLATALRGGGLDGRLPCCSRPRTQVARAAARSRLCSCRPHTSPGSASRSRSSRC